VFNLDDVQLLALGGRVENFEALAPFGYADKPAEKHCWLICCERKILSRLKKQVEKDGLEVE
jgi:hypothetical protein